MSNIVNIISISFCDSNNAYKLFSLFGKVFNIIKILVPIIIILYGMIDLIKGTINPNKKNNFKLFIKRLIHGVLFFFLITIITFIFSLINNNLDNKCMEIFLNPNDITINAIDIDNIKNKNECNKLGSPYIWVEDECRIDVSNDKVGE